MGKRGTLGFFLGLAVGGALGALAAIRLWPAREGGPEAVETERAIEIPPRWEERVERFRSRVRQAVEEGVEAARRRREALEGELTEEG